MSTTTITSNISGACGTVRTNATAPTAPGSTCNVVSNNATVTTSITEDNIGGVTESGDSIVLPSHVKKAKITLPTYSVTANSSTSDYSLSLVSADHTLNGGSTFNNVILRMHCIDGNGDELGNIMYHPGGPGYVKYKSNLVGQSSYSHSIVRNGNDEAITSLFALGSGSTMTITPLGESLAERTISFQFRATDAEGSGGPSRYSAQTSVL